MAFEITIPRLGWSMEEGVFVRWLKRDGDTVVPGEPLFELEGEKAAQDVEAVDGGVLRIPPSAPQPNTSVAVGTVIGYLVDVGEQSPVATSGSAMTVESRSDKATGPLEPVARHEAVAPPSVRRMARERGLNLNLVTGSGPSGRILAADLGVSNPGRRPDSHRSSVASPRARRVARELGVDWKSVAGSGRNGRVRERDVVASAHSLRAATPVGPVTGHGATIPITRHRRTIADRMTRSRQQTAPVTLTTRVDATNLVSLRQQFKAAGEEIVPSYSDIVIKLAAMVLKQQPQMTSQWSGNHLVIPGEIHVGLAVDTDAGRPRRSVVIRDAGLQ